MFQEREENKPKRWGFLVFIVAVVTTFNLAVVITIRALLDSEDEINEPVIQGELRRDLTAFLGVFTLTFFFGCWCCFCCGCFGCRWLLCDCPGQCVALMSDLCGSMFGRQIERRKFGNEFGDSELQITDVVVQARGVVQNQMENKTSDNFAYENPVAIQHFIEAEAEAPSHLLSVPRYGRRSQSIDIGIQ
ncbi:hypothetical protein WR25_06717 isoform A [Diploscapter pachys]|uniref:Uncharacterized protein n=1 Tax=Diploscapter pachys TaxID=2018661 RepID=A0A2A2M148_9BILA|nr:hypothetical protein WR25_06717 isoform A [Diploscapter pachys]